MPAHFHVEQLTEITKTLDREPTYLAIGSFDGVHRGHQALLQQLSAAARRDGVRSAVLTFFPHPKRVIQNLTGPYYLARREDRVALLAQQGVDLIITHPFNETVRQTRAAAFVDELIATLDMRQLWGGYFALGYQREGDIPHLRQLGQEKGYDVVLVDALVQYEGERVSSSRIRRALAEGNLEEVNGCLGRPFHIRGTVVEGDRRGRTIGFPTANMAVWAEQMLPAKGVYATMVEFDGERHVAAANVGVRPTVNGHTLMVEPHLLDFEGDLYGRELRLEFHHRVRPEQKFSGLNELKAQIAADVAQVRLLLEIED